MRHDDLCNLAQPRLSIITPSLNHGRFLRDTIESILGQSYRNFEHIVVDGGSTDGTLDILREYPHIRWISEPDNSIMEAYQKCLAMVRGEYVIQCCVSDGFLDRRWFETCVDVLDRDTETALVWGFSQYMSEESRLLNVAFQDLFNDPPPQKQEFLAMWLASGFVLPEGNYCVRSDVIRRLFPNAESVKHFQIHPHLGFMYQFAVQGYMPYFLPWVANYGRTHHDQRGQRLTAVEAPARQAYYRDIDIYARRLLTGNVTHCFRDGRSNVIGEISQDELRAWRRKIRRHRLLRSRLLRLDLYSLAMKIKDRIQGK